MKLTRTDGTVVEHHPLQAICGTRIISMELFAEDIVRLLELSDTELRQYFSNKLTRFPPLEKNK